MHQGRHVSPVYCRGSQQLRPKCLHPSADSCRSMTTMPFPHILPEFKTAAQMIPPTYRMHSGARPTCFHQLSWIQRSWVQLIIVISTNKNDQHCNNNNNAIAIRRLIRSILMLGVPCSDCSSAVVTLHVHRTVCAIYPKSKVSCLKRP